MLAARRGTRSVQRLEPARDRDLSGSHGDHEMTAEEQYVYQEHLSMVCCAKHTERSVTLRIAKSNEARKFSNLPLDTA